MSRPLYPHDMNLGELVDPGSLSVLLQSNRDAELIRGILQLLRNHAAQIERTGRQTPAEIGDPLEWRAYHAGGADATEEVLQILWGLANPKEQPDESASTRPAVN